MKYLFLTGISLIFFSCDMLDEIRNSLDSDDITGSMSLNLDIESDIPVSSSKGGTLSLDVSNFYIQIVNSNGVAVKEIASYLELKNGVNNIELPVGTYTVKASSYAGNIKEATLGQPYYYGEQEVKIEEGEQKNISVVCSLQNVVVDITYDEEFLANVKSDFEVSLTNGNGILILKKDIDELAFFKEASYILMTVKATTHEGNSITSSTYFRNEKNKVDAGDWFKVTVNVEDITDPGTEEPGPDPDPNPGNGSFTIIIDVTLEGREVQIEIPRPNDPNPSLGDPSIIGAEEIYVFDRRGNPQDPNRDEIKVYMNAPNGIKHLYVNIESTSESFMTDEITSQLLYFDAANPGDLYGLLSGFNLIPEDGILEKTETVFDVSTFVLALGAFGENTHYFKLELVDQKGKTVEDTLTIQILQNLN